MSARYGAKLYDNGAWKARFDQLRDAESEVTRKEQRLEAMLGCLGQVAVDISCNGESSPKRSDAAPAAPVT